MIWYLDASVLLRRMLEQPGALEIDPHTTLITSALTEVECLRTLDRRRVRGMLNDEDLALVRSSVLDALGRMRIVDVTPDLLRRAADPFPTPVGTLDSIHLASAIAVADDLEEEIPFATHDAELARCALACGLEVIGP